MQNAWAGGGSDYPVQKISPHIEQNIKRHIIKTKPEEIKEEIFKDSPIEYVGTRTDAFVQVRSDVHWFWLAGGGICLVIGILVAVIILAKITPIGQMITKVWNALVSMFKALLAWKPKGK